MKVVDYDRIQWYLGAREDGAPTVYTTAREVDDVVFEIDEKTHDLLPKIGSWKRVPSIIGVKYQCSMCYKIYRMSKNVYNFCPCCGATMSYESEGTKCVEKQ